MSSHENPSHKSVDLLDRARAKINPWHADVPGTDSHLISELVQRIDALETAIRETIEDNLHLADGDNACNSGCRD